MLVDFTGYAADCIVVGQLDVAGTRVSDALDGKSMLTLRNATLTSLDGGREVFESELQLGRDELYAVEAAGPAGDIARRVRKVRHRLRAEMGPYVVMGQLHVLPGAPPLRGLRGRRMIVPLTHASILVPSDAGLYLREARVLLINVLHIDSVRLMQTDESPWELTTVVGEPRRLARVPVGLPEMPRGLPVDRH